MLTERNVGSTKKSPGSHRDWFIVRASKDVRVVDEESWPSTEGDGTPSPAGSYQIVYDWVRGGMRGLTTRAGTRVYGSRP